MRLDPARILMIDSSGCRGCTMGHKVIAECILMYVYGWSSAGKV